MANKKEDNNYDIDNFSSENTIDKIMEHCLRNKDFKIMKNILRYCRNTYSKHDYYLQKMLDAIENK